MADINKKVLNWIKKRIGQTVGKGECWDVAEGALADAGAKTSSDYGGITDDADYKWGRAISLDSAKPGDILQFRDYSCTTKVDDEDSISESHVETKHHTSVLAEAIDASHGQWKVYHQNYGGNRVVTNDAMNLKNTTIITRTSITTVVCTGDMWVYRPQSKN